MFDSFIDNNQRREKVRRLVLVLSLMMVCLGITALAHAGSVVTTITNLGPNSWEFDYKVTSIYPAATTGPYTDMAGLCGFAVQVPIGTVSAITNPAPYTSWAYQPWNTQYPPHWAYAFSSGSGGLPYTLPTLKSGYQWLGWWGYEPPSVYPLGTTAEFSFQADGVTVANSADATIGVSEYTSTGNIYGADLVNLDGPAIGNSDGSSVPEPSTLLLFGGGLVGLVGLRWRRK
jgi:hypothetical protein